MLDICLILSSSIIFIFCQSNLAVIFPNAVLISEHVLVELSLITVVISEALVHMLWSQPWNRSLV